MRTVSERATWEPEHESLAHHLANLVQAVSGNLELLAARTTDEAARRYLANAQAATRQIEDLTRKLRGEDD